MAFAQAAGLSKKDVIVRARGSYEKVRTFDTYGA